MPLNRQILTGFRAGKNSYKMIITAQKDMEVDGTKYKKGEDVEVTKKEARKIMKDHSKHFSLRID